MNTLLEFTTAPGSWEAHYWIATQTLSSDGHYVEYVVNNLSSGCGYGVSPDSNGSPTNAYVVWVSSGVTYILLNGSVNATYAGIVMDKMDRIRFRKSGSNIIVSRNGTDFHTIALSGTVYAYAASFNGTSSVRVDSVNGAAVTTLASAAVTVTLGIPTTDYYANDSSIYYSPYNWLGTGRVKEATQPGSYFKFRFTGTRAGIIFNAERQVFIIESIRTWIAYRIDGGAWTRSQLADPDATYLEIATGLTDTTHTAEVLVSEAYLVGRYHATAASRGAALLSYGVRLPVSGTILAPQIKPILLMGFGDSNSEGAEAIATNLGGQHLSFAQLIADSVNVEFAQTSAPGQGWDKTPDSSIPTMQDGWDMRIDGSSRLTGGMLVPEPYAVFICHGQNDIADVTTVATNTINAMLAATTNTKIVVMCPVGRHRRSELIAAVAAVANSRCVFFDNATDYLATQSQGGLGIHLTAAGQSAFATEQMIPQFRAIIPRIQTIQHHYRQGAA